MVILYYKFISILSCILFFRGNCEFTGSMSNSFLTPISIRNKGSILISKGLSYRKWCSINVQRHGKLDIGSNVFMNNNTSINVHSCIKIGSDVLFGENVKVYDHDHDYKDIYNRKNSFIVNDVIIGNNVWIGSNVIILKGVTIGDNSVISAGSVLSKSVNNNVVYIKGEERKIK